MLRLEKWPPAPKVTSSNPPMRLLREGAASMNNRIACSMSRLTDVPDSDARCFSLASRLSSSVIVVRMMHDRTSLASVHQERVGADAVSREVCDDRGRTQTSLGPGLPEPPPPSHRPQPRGHQLPDGAPHRGDPDSGRTAP